jgi:hypothetical protein
MATTSSRDGGIVGVVFRSSADGGELVADNDSAAISDSVTLQIAGLTWTDMPAALTEFNNSTTRRCKKSLVGAQEARIVARVEVVGATNAQLRVQYSTNESSWSYLDGSAGPGVGIATTGTRASSWVTLEAAARADVVLRIVGIDGDGALDPQFGSIFLEVR